jgi:DNA-binding FadR family transcriptional regulator
VTNVRQKAEKACKRLVCYIEQKIADGSWSSGDRLPTERELVCRFGVARNTVRKALRALELKRRIVRQVGRGTFVAAPAVPDGARTLIESITGASPAEVLEIRTLIEAQLVDLIVARATMGELRELESILENAERSETFPEWEQWNAKLHLALVAVTKNRLLIDIYEAINLARFRPEWVSLRRRAVTRERRIESNREHRRIVEALKQREPEAARIAMQEHLHSVRMNLFEE